VRPLIPALTVCLLALPAGAVKIVDPPDTLPPGSERHVPKIDLPDPPPPGCEQQATNFTHPAPSGSVQEAEEGEHRVAYYLQNGWEIRSAVSSPHPLLVLQKGAAAVYCQMKDETVEIKGVPQLMTASCAVIR
jgi:hypothetical protein